MKKEIKTCDYGCGKEATHQFKNGKWCCCKSCKSCEKSRSNNKPNLGKFFSKEIRLKMSESHKGDKNVSKLPDVQKKQREYMLNGGAIKAATAPRDPEKMKIFSKSQRKRMLTNNMAVFVATVNMKISVEKHRRTMIDKGHWTKPEDIPKFLLYSRTVWNFTRRSMKEKYSIEELKTRGTSKTSNNIDHIFSIKEGFKQNINPEVIGSKSNIRLINCRNNYVKKTKCDISKEQLFERYNQERNKT